MLFFSHNTYFGTVKIQSVLNSTSIAFDTSDRFHLYVFWDFWRASFINLDFVTVMISAQFRNLSNT